MKVLLKEHKGILQLITIKIIKRRVGEGGACMNPQPSQVNQKEIKMNKKRKKIVCL